MTVIHGDALEVMRSMPSGSYDIVVTSPPYNLRTTTSGGFGPNSLWRQAREVGGLAGGYDGYSDDLPEEEYEVWQNACVKEMLRLVRPRGGGVFYNHRWRSQGGQWQDRRAIFDGVPIRQIIIWSRGPGVNANRTMFMPAYEVVYLLTNPGFVLEPGMQGMTDVWAFPPEKGSDHPAPFPVELPLRCIKATGAKRVLDPFGGSGTTAVAAKMLGAECDLIEQSERYCRMAEDRIAKASPPVTLEGWM